jgi:hypothetical protein
MEAQLIELDDIVSGKRGVIIDNGYMTDIANMGFYTCRDSIADSLMRAFDDLESESQQERRVSRYYMGVAQIANPLHDLKHPDNSKGLEMTYEDHGGNGLLVLSVITKETIPLSLRESLTVKEYATAVCQQVIHLLKIVSKDTRLINVNTTDEPWKNETTQGCVIYATLTLS